ncbi:MAG TPA: LysR family transcriptional regulator [Paenalcaligenes sp.]|nr:LysR family transcriptional regulator [Paenalcaligenes sp.]
MNHTPDTKRLFYFQQVVLSGSLRAAAEVLDVDASSISRAIAQLETEVGMTLLARKGRGVVPTEEGLILANYAQQQAKLTRELYQCINEHRQAQRGQIALGLGEGMLDLFFYPVITQFMAQNPSIKIQLVVAGSQSLIEGLLEDRLDMALLYQATQDVRLRRHHLWTSSPIQTVVHKDHPLTAIHRPLTLADLLPHKGASLQEHFGLREFISQAEQDERVQLNFDFVTSSYRALWQYAYAGLGYILSGTSFVHTYQLPDLVLLPMANQIFNSCGIGTVTRQGKYLSPAAVALLEHLKKQVPAYATLPRAADSIK